VVSDSERPVPVEATTVVDLAKSAARFSMAMGLFAVRQTARLVSGQRDEAAASLDRVSDAASTRLSGTTKSAYAIGTDVQSGLLHAASNLADVGPRGQAPTASTAGLAMSFRKSASRRLHGIRTVASGALTRPVPQDELRRRLAGYHNEVMASGPDRVLSVDGLWRSEGLATTIAKYPHPDNSWIDPALPRTVLPVEHVGFGSGCASATHLDAARLHAIFSERCADQFRDFSYEGVGAILRARESGFFKLMSGAMGLMPFDTPASPDRTGFFADYLSQFPPHVQRLIAHGYGRIYTVSHMDIYATIKNATALPAERVEPVVHGAAFAFLMFNSVDLPHILRHSAVPFESPVRAAFQNGLIYGLAFLDWYAPGYLARWQPQERLEAELVEHARRESALAQDRGFPLAFRLAAPRV